MNNRDRWRICKRVAIAFFLTLVTITVVLKGGVGSGASLEFERQPPMDMPEKVEPMGGENADSYHVMKDFWMPRKHQQVPKSHLSEQESALPEESNPRTWDVTTINCTANANLTAQDWFLRLNRSFQQFMLYRHCRYFPILINHPEKCTGDIYMLVVIKSLATQHDRREVIRRTWGKEQAFDGKKIKLLFLLALPPNEVERANHQKLVEYEDHIYGDILQWDFLDSFFNLTLKEIHFLKWFHTYCPTVRYIFKGDDDVFVGIANILEYLELNKDAKDLFVGDVIFGARPIRVKKNKYYMPESIYNKTYYPPYAGGGGFLMDARLAKRLHWAADSLELFPIDDVFLGMCLDVLDVTPIKHNAFKTFGLVKQKSSKLNKEPCFFKSMIVVHKMLPPDLIRMWNLMESDLICSHRVTIL